MPIGFAFLNSIMLIHQLRLQNFRNYETHEIEWAPHLNLLTGPNGAGKTSLIDAVHYLCMSRSFVSNSDQYCVRFKQKSFEIEGSFSGRIRSRFDLSLSYTKGKGKEIQVNQAPLQKLTDLIGRVPVVVLSPEDKLLTSDGPILRRSYIDSFICQLSRVYLDALLEYKRVLRQRNSFLQQCAGRFPASAESMLEVWDEVLARKGSAIIKKRLEVLNRFKTHLQEQYQKISSIPLVPDLSYKSFEDFNESMQHEDMVSLYLERLKEKRGKELERGLTLIGPHRDDIIFYLNEQELRHFGSQGQHRLFALSLKMAQLFYYEEDLEDLPLFLMDDVFGDIDAQKIDILLEMLNNHEGQLFITAANHKLFDNLQLEKGRDTHFRIESQQH